MLLDCPLVDVQQRMISTDYKLVDVEKDWSINMYEY